LLLVGGIQDVDFKAVDGANMPRKSNCGEEIVGRFISFVHRGFRFLLRLIHDFLQGRHTSDVSQILSLVRLLRPVPSPFKLLRLGGSDDGGYLVPEDLKGITDCFSPGVGNVMDFELDLANIGIRCHLIDHSVSDIPVHHQLISFERLFLGDCTLGNWTTLGDWLKEVSPKGDCILQMDIEGGEYAVLNEVSASDLQRFRIIVVEFHGLADFASTTGGIRKLKRALRKLLGSHKIVHIHPNNCCPAISVSGVLVPPVLEVTLLRRDRFMGIARFPVEVPHRLDVTNVGTLPAISLTSDWLKSRKPLFQPKN